MEKLNVGNIVNFRKRDWVVIPSPEEDVLLLRPLTGSENEVCGISHQLIKFGFERVESAIFPLPNPEDASDAIGIELLFNAARLSLRDGAGPFRSLGRVSVRPRPYQFVPLLMALRLHPVRLLIADDVGIGKTIEALLIAREFLDRGEIQRVCVLCPPYLCDQWKKELWEKFHIDAVIIRSGTISQLERNLPSGDHSIFGYYPHIVVSIDYAKSERHSANFLHHCPEFVIVDEVHAASQQINQRYAQQQRHQLLKKLTEKPERHMVLLTATPHSGVETSFLSILSLLKYDFSMLSLQRLSENERDTLSRHFIQRRRADVIHWLGEETPFPDRESMEETYELSPAYRELFHKVYNFSRDLVHTGETLTGWKRRIRYWTALALLRCVMSSTAAALAAFEARVKGMSLDEEASDDTYAPYIYESTDEDTLDVTPGHIVEEGEKELPDSERRKIRDFARLAAKINGTLSDSKILKCIEVVSKLLREGYHPIVWCRYIATSDSVAKEIEAKLKNEFRGIRVVSITGAVTEEERRMVVEEISKYPVRVLVATDCLSEGVNLQESFSAVIHYDLPWNPNRLEQREGRVDRFGQYAKKVKTILLYGKDNPIDGAVLEVILKKVKEIRRTLGISMSMPVDSETIMNAILKTLFFRETQETHPRQLPLFKDEAILNFHRLMDDAASREKESRTRFAQRSIKPEEVEKELKETDTVLGDPDAVKNFVINACQRFGITVRSDTYGIFTLSGLQHLPEIFLDKIPSTSQWQVVFSTPTPEKVTYLGRNHPFVGALAQYLLEDALTRMGDAMAPRCGVVRTTIVGCRTNILLLKLRFTIEDIEKKPLLAEEVFVCGFHGLTPDKLEWLQEDRPLHLLKHARPERNITPSERYEILKESLSLWDNLQNSLKSPIEEQRKKLEDAHRRVRASAHLSRKISLKYHFPPDLLGILVLQPIPKGISR